MKSAYIEIGIGVPDIVVYRNVQLPCCLNNVMSCEVFGCTCNLKVFDNSISTSKHYRILSYKLLLF